MQVGKEFGSVEALWSQFENFMARTDEEGDTDQKQNVHNEDDHDHRVHEQDDDEGVAG